MRRDMLGEIRDMKDVTNVLVLTHNIDFVFVQTMVLSALRRCGHPTLTILADAGCAATSFASQAPLLSGLGTRYRVVPIAMKESGFRFHPKAVFLSGPQAATLYVGSGNLTFGGWRENAETWVRFQSESDGTAAIAGFREYVEAATQLASLPDGVRGEIQAAFDATTRPWAAELELPGGLLGTVGQGPSLWNRMRTQLSGSTYRLTICAPYFDDTASALSTILDEAGPVSTEVLVQPGRGGPTDSAWKKVAGRAQLKSVTVQHMDDKGHSREAFLHAKWFAFENADRVTLFVGSANCSRAALIAPAGNAELMAVREMKSEDFTAAFLDDLSDVSGPPVLPAERPKEPKTSVRFRLLGATYERDYLRVAYEPKTISVTGCFVDGKLAQFDLAESGIVGIALPSPPRQVALEASDSEGTVRSEPVWVDCERELASTARLRTLGDTIRRSISGDRLELGPWAELIDVFCAHLRYLPAQSATTRSAGLRSKAKDATPVKYVTADIFATDFRPPSLEAYVKRLAIGKEDRVRSLQQLLLRWYGDGLGAEEADIDDPSPEDSEPDIEEAVDTLVKLPPSKPKPVKKADERELKRADRAVSQMSMALTSTEFLMNRPPELLAIDLRGASTLLRVALREGWLDSSRFFLVTHDIWMALFFESLGKNIGWLQRRYESAPEPDDFASAMRSPDILAALLAWTLAMADEGRTPARARFQLAAALGVARLPWLWDGIDIDVICSELAKALVYVTPPNQDPSADHGSAQWFDLFKRGHALRRLERAVIGMTPAQLAPKVRETSVAKGELLWQGTAGFCVASHAAGRTPAGRIQVLPLRTDPATDSRSKKQTKTGNPKRAKAAGRGKSDLTDGVMLFQGDLTVPLYSLLDEAVVPITGEFDDTPRAVLKDFIAELSLDLGGNA